MDASRLSEFRFTESQWDAISAQLERTGRLKNDGDRQILEMICNHFAQLRPRLKRNAPTPKRRGINGANLIARLTACGRRALRTSPF